MSEGEIARERVALLTHDMIVTLDGSSVCVRLTDLGDGKDARYLALPAADALKLGARLMQAALRIDPKLATAVTEAQTLKKRDRA